MSRKIVAIPLALLLLLVAAKPPTPRLLSSDAINVEQLLPDPPAKGSVEERAEMQLILQLQSARSQADIDRATAEAKFNVFSFADLIGPGFTPEKCPQTADLFQAIEAESKAFTKPAKTHWNRPRPALADNRVKPSIEGEIDPGYPSGHATRGILIAEILAELFPDQRSALQDRGRQIGFDRVIAGVHYPSDIYAGRTLGQAIAQALLKNEAFRQKLQTVRPELAQFLNTRTAASR